MVSTRIRGNSCRLEINRRKSIQSTLDNSNLHGKQKKSSTYREFELSRVKLGLGRITVQFLFWLAQKKVTQPEIKIKLTTLGSHFNQVKIENVNHAGNLTAGKLTFPRTNHAAEQNSLHRNCHIPVVFSYSTTTKSTACFCFADGKMDK